MMNEDDGRIYRDCAMNNAGPTCYILSTRTCICVGHDSSYAAFFSIVGDSKWTEDRGYWLIDLWSDDTKKDAWFTESALDIGFQWLESVFPGFTVYLFSGESSFHNKEVEILSLINCITLIHTRLNFHWSNAAGILLPKVL